MLVAIICQDILGIINHELGFCRVVLFWTSTVLAFLFANKFCMCLYKRFIFNCVEMNMFSLFQLNN